MSASRVGLNGYFGPTANSIPRASGVGGRTLKSSGLTISDNNCLTIPGSTITANEPVLNLSQIWNNGSVRFDSVKLDITRTAAANGSNYLTFYNAGSIVGGIEANSGGGGTLYFTTGASIKLGAATNASAPTFFLSDSGPIMKPTAYVSWCSSTDLVTQDVLLYRDAANTLALRNGVNAQAFNIYNTYTNVSNYERAKLGWNANVFEVRTQAGGTTARALRFATSDALNIYLSTNNTDRFYVSGSGGHFLANVNNTYDIGGGTDLNPRHVYASTSLQVISNSGYLGIGASAPDVFLYREAANTFAQRNGVNAQTLNVYNTYTSSTNYERLGIYWSGNNAYILTQQQTGSARALNIGTAGNVGMYFHTNGGAKWYLESGGNLLCYTDNTYDIGASGANRPRTGYFGTSVVAPSFIGENRVASNGIISEPSIPISHYNTLFNAIEMLCIPPLLGNPSGIVNTVTANGGTATLSHMRWNRLQTGTTANGMAMIRWNDGVLNNTATYMHRQWGVDGRKIPWNLPTVWSFMIDFAGAGISTNGMVRLFVGKKLDGNANPSGAGVGIRINSSKQFVLIVHNGTTLVESSPIAAISPNIDIAGMVIEVLLSSDGAGVLTAYVNQQLIGTLSGAPTTLGVQNECSMCCEVNNGGDAVNNQLNVSRLAFIRP